MQTGRFKRGFVREDGLVFWCYAKGVESWTTADTYKSRKQKAAAMQREYYASNKERIRAIERACYYKNKAKRLRYKSEYDRKNADKIAAYSKSYIKLNYQKLLANNARRRAMKKGQTPENANKKLIETFYDQATRLSRAWSAPHIEPRFRVAFAVDHIVPLSRGGLHEPSNLQVIPASLNARKNDKLNYPMPSGYANAVQVFN